jgi:hypothetical protein
MAQIHGSAGNHTVRSDDSLTSGDRPDRMKQAEHHLSSSSNTDANSNANKHGS